MTHLFDFLRWGKIALTDMYNNFRRVLQDSSIFRDLQHLEIVYNIIYLAGGQHAYLAGVHQCRGLARINSTIFFSLACEYFTVASAVIGFLHFGLGCLA